MDKLTPADPDQRRHKEAKRWQPEDGCKTICRTCGGEMFICLASAKWWCVNDPELPSSVMLEGIDNRG